MVLYHGKYYNIKEVHPSFSICNYFPVFDSFRENHEPERLGLNGIAETTVAMEVT